MESGVKSCQIYCTLVQLVMILTLVVLCQCPGLAPQRSSVLSSYQYCLKDIKQWSPFLCDDSRHRTVSNMLLPSQGNLVSLDAVTLWTRLMVISICSSRSACNIYNRKTWQFQCVMRVSCHPSGTHMMCHCISNMLFHVRCNKWDILSGSLW